MEPNTNGTSNMPPKMVKDHPSFVGKLTREEFLELENLSLKTQNLALQEEKLQADLIKANGMRQELQKQLTSLKDSLGRRLNVNIMASTTKILEDGSVLDTSRTSTDLSEKVAG